MKEKNKRIPVKEIKYKANISSLEADLILTLKFLIKSMVQQIQRECKIKESI